MANYDYNPKYGLENYSFVLPFEENFDSEKSTLWLARNWVHSITWSVAYLAVIFGGRKLMENRKPFGLDGPLVFWNAGLAIFSILGFLRMTPEWVWSVFGEGNSLKYSICTASFAQGVSGFWTEAFAMSKVAELVDTVFIVLRKKPLIFLHYYHHVTVLIYTWHAYKDHTASGRWFIYMNYCVHAVMYSYYAFRAMRFRTPKWTSMLITVMQIAQMVAGVGIGISVWNIKSSGGECQQTWENLQLNLTMYFTYFLLFCNFFYQAYLRPNSRYDRVRAAEPKVATVIEDKKEVDENRNETNGSVHKSNGSAMNDSIANGVTTRRRAARAD